MKGLCSHRKLLIGLIVTASFFFVFLGMRNPYLNHNHGPKQRPRAICVKTASLSEDHVKSHGIDIADVQNFVAALPCGYFLLTSQVIPRFQSVCVAKPAARAPPAVHS